jgi:outer membrane protein, heavy metal efflux system
VTRLVRCLSLALAVILSTAVASAQSLPIDDPEVLAQLAVDQQPGLDALRARIDSLEQVASVAGVWMDPMLMLEFSNLPVTAPWIDQHPMSGIQLKLQQRFPAPGQTKARAGAADARVDVAGASVAALENRLRGEVRGRYWDLALVRQLRDVTREHVAELDGLLESVQVRYQVGAANQHDLLQLQLRRDRLAETLPDFDARADIVQAVLNGALARDPAFLISTPNDSPVDALPGTAADRASLLDAHPALRVLHARAQAERAEADRARAEALPGPTAWLGYRIRAPQMNGDPGTNLASVGVSVPLPAASTRRWNGMAGAAEARALAAEEMAQARKVRLTAMLAASETKHARAVDRATAYRDSLESAARAALDSTRSAYQVDRAGFADLIRAEIALLDVKRHRLRAQAEAASARAEILTLLGRKDAAGATP